MLTSVVSYPNRGTDGSSRYPGNFPGPLVEDLLEHFEPRQVLEVFAGGGTGFDVARRMGYSQSVHLDLNPRFGGWNALRDQVPEGSDFIIAHPPYHDIVKYSGKAWGTQAHPDDLSNCGSYDEFIKKLDQITASLFSSLRSGGRLVYLVGEVRKKGELHSMFNDMLKLGKLEAHIVKLQHNTTSGRRSYPGGSGAGDSLDNLIARGGRQRMSFVPIMHEDIVVMQRPHLIVIPMSFSVRQTRDFFDSPAPTWRDLVQTVMEQLGGRAHLSELYEALEGSYKAKNNKHWKDAIRRTVNDDPRNFTSIDGRGTWELKPLPGRVKVPTPELSL